MWLFYAASPTRPRVHVAALIGHGEIEASRLEEILSSAEVSVSDGDADLRPTGFWSAVAAVKRDPALRDDYAARLAAVDRKAFEQWALLRVGLWAGTWIMLIGTAIAIGVIGAAYSAQEPWNGVLLLVGTGALLTTTHGLAHLAVGSLSGIRFTDWFIGSTSRLQPGVKIDYESYLATPALQRARMHAAGAVVTKLMPFLLLGAAYGMSAQTWVWIALIVVGLGQLATDALWSVSSSDWKRYRREKRYAD